MPPIDHDFVRVAADGAGKRVGNVVWTDPDGNTVYGQKTVVADPETATDAGLQRVTAGRAHVQQRAEEATDATATWTSVTADETTLSLAVGGYSVSVLNIYETGTFSTGALEFEASADGGTSWFPIEGISTITRLTEFTYSAGSNPDFPAAYQFNVAGYTHVRVRLSAVLDAGGTSIALRLRATSGESIFSIVHGNVDVDYLGTDADVEATGNGSLIAITKRLRTLLSGTGVVKQKAEVTEATGTLDAVNETVELTLTGHDGAFYTAVGDLNGTIQFEGRGSSASDWGPISVLSENSGASVMSQSASGDLWDVGVFYAVVGYEAVRIRCTARTSGSAAIVLRTTPRDPVQRVTASEPLSARNAAGTQVDGHSATLGSTTDAEATGNGSVVAILKRIRTLLGGTLTVAGTVTATVSGVATETSLGLLRTVNVGPTDEGQPASDTSSGYGLNGRLQRIAQRLTSLIGLFPTSLGQKTMANSLAVTVASDQSAVPVSGTFWQATQPVSGTVSVGNFPSTQATTPAGNATATLTNVNDSASSVTLLSANSARKGATIHNDSTAILYVKFGTTASTTSYTVKMVADAYYEVPFDYTGRIDGIWASDASGAARVTEISA